MKTSFQRFFASQSMRIWGTCWLLIYLCICIFGLIAPDSLLLTIIKVGSIFLCFLYTFYYSPKDRLLQLAFLTTFLADLILARDNTSEFGVLTFFATQLIHLYRQLPPKTHHLPLLIFILSAIATASIVTLIDSTYTMIAICAFYLVAIITNIVLAAHWFRQAPHFLPAFCALLGFVLFLCCDTCTGLSYLSLNHFLPNFFYRPANFFAWFFYYPSQIFLSNSPKCATINPEKKIVL